MEFDLGAREGWAALAGMGVESVAVAKKDPKLQDRVWIGLRAGPAQAPAAHEGGPDEDFRRWLAQVLGAGVLGMVQGLGLDLLGEGGSGGRASDGRGRTLALCDPRDCRYAHWSELVACLGAPSWEWEDFLASGIVRTWKVADALRGIYRRAEILEGWQIRGLLARGMPRRLDRLAYASEASKASFGQSKRVFELHEFGLMREAVDGDLGLAPQAWRLPALAQAVDPWELDSRGVSAWDWVRSRLVELGPGQGEERSMIAGFDAFFQALDLQRGVPMAAPGGVAAPRL